MIRLIGLGPGSPEALSRGAEQALRTSSEAAQHGAGLLFLRTARHPVVATLDSWGLRYETFDDLYHSAADFDSVYSGIATRVIYEAEQLSAHQAAVTYAVPGHPLFAEDSVRRIREEAAARAIPIDIVASSSFVDAALATARVDLGAGCDIRDALSLTGNPGVDRDGNPSGAPFDVTRGLLLYQVYDTHSASAAKLALMESYPDDWELVIIRAAGVQGEERVTRLPLYRLDRSPVDHLTSVYVPPLPPSRRRPGFAALVGIMDRLREPDGCPWDREQSHQTLKRFLIEETYEVIEAIDGGDMEELCEELGDLMLQVVFHARLASEVGHFNIEDVSQRIVTKLIRRHPHVFGTVEVSGSDEVLKNWERIKRGEKSADPSWRPSALDGVPQGLPALMRAMELSKRAAKVGFEWPDFPAVLDKLDEEVRELRAALQTGDQPSITGELGDLLFTAVQIARWKKIDPEDALRQMLARFTARFQFMETTAAAQNRTLESLSPEELDALWTSAKVSTG